MLYELNKLSKSELLLNDYLLEDNQNPEANILLANINYWKGHFKTAREKVAVVLNAYPNNEKALAILKDINIYSAPYLKLDADFASDNQPLEKIGYNLETGWNNSWLFSPVFQASSYSFNSNEIIYNSFWMQLSNKILFGHSGFALNLKAGIFKHPGVIDPIFTGTAAVSQKLSKSLTLSACTEKIPYQYTIKSIEMPVMQQLSNLALNLNKNNKWLGKAAYELQQFDDANKLQTAYIWALIPLLHRQSFKFKAGYAFSYANADNNAFTLSKPLSTIIAAYKSGNTVPGVYIPYFTPNNQIINSVVTSFDIMFSKNLSFTLNANIGVLAYSNIPELVLTKNQGNNYSIIKSYNKQTFLPGGIQSEIKLKLSDRLTLSGIYEYSRLSFYTINKGSMALKYAFINEKKK